MTRRTTLLAALGAGALAASPARADPLPLRIDFQAPPGCPSEEVFLDEIRWRTALARTAAVGEAALEVRARITRRGDVHHGHLVLGGRERIVREIDGQICDEVVSALALVTALAVDPGASIARRPPSGGMPVVPPPAPPAPPFPPGPGAAGGAPVAADSLPAPEIVGPPLPVVPAPPDVPPPREGTSFGLGAWASAAFAVAPRPLLGGGVAADWRFPGRWTPSLRLGVEVAGTGAFDVGPGGASLLRAAGRVQGCMFAWRPAAWLSLVPCLAGGGGALHAEGIVKGTVTHVGQVTVPWAALGALPRIELGSGRWAFGLEGGPVFPLVQRSFVFQSPAYVVSTLPPVTATVGIGATVRFP
jgi:hypothetical protein